MGAGPGTVMQLAGARESSRAAQAAATSQQDAAQRERGAASSLADSINADLTDLSKATPQELNSLQAAYNSSTKQLEREERMIAAIDPSILEASKQALSLLRGETAAANNPLMAARNAQRQQLLNSLRSQYGPGAESTSIGQRALSQFDMESNSMFQQNQQNSLGQMFGIATTDLGARTQRATQNFLPIAQGYGNLQERQVQARQAGGQGQLSAFMGTNQGIMQSAGARYVGQAIQGQALQSTGQQWQNSDSQMMGSAMGMFTGGMGGGAQPAAAPADYGAAGGNYTGFSNYA